MRVALSARWTFDLIGSFIHYIMGFRQTFLLKACVFFLLFNSKYYNK